MSNRESGLQETLVAAFDNQISNVYTAIPCIVVAVRDAEGGLVDIQPTINQKFKDGTQTQERAVILGVPVSFPVSSTAGVLFPIKEGTTGTAIFSMRSIEVWKSGRGRPATPNNYAKFDKSDALFFPGITPPSVNAARVDKHTWPHSTDDVVVFNNLQTANENEIRLKASGDIQITTTANVSVQCNNAQITAQQDVDVVCANFTVDAATSINMTAPTASISFGTTSWNGSYSGTGTFTFNGIDFSTHVHGGSVGPSNP